MGIHSGMNIRITKQIGGGVNGWSYYDDLTRGMGERLTYGIPARYRVVLMERLGGLFFDGGRSCVGPEILFAGHSGLYRCESFVVSILFLCVGFGRRALNSVFSW